MTIDDTHRLFYIGNEKIWRKSIQNPVVYSFDEVVSYNKEIVGQKIQTKKKGGITRALVGGAIAGPAGALIGAGTAKTETKTTGGQEKLNIEVNAYGGHKTVSIFQAPAGLTNFLDNIIAQEKHPESTVASSGFSVADELLKYKQLLDAGVITQEEFDEQKKKLLS
ncbi:SHOCT domain-containing protein [Lachnospiraceae bacterium YH-ros2228]